MGSCRVHPSPQDGSPIEQQRRNLPKSDTDRYNERGFSGLVFLIRRRPGLKGPPDSSCITDLDGSKKPKSW